mmetsp:Transcript_61136/g.98906  ORF Transcript_61136/g.98906 Transcript_61136/m.98906 type:complete len:237 (+) Transcript_61136:756-1466(+)
MAASLDFVYAASAAAMRVASAAASMTAMRSLRVDISLAFLAALKISRRDFMFPNPGMSRESSEPFVSTPKLSFKAGSCTSSFQANTRLCTCGVFSYHSNTLSRRTCVILSTRNANVSSVSFAFFFLMSVSPPTQRLRAFMGNRISSLTVRKLKQKTVPILMPFNKACSCTSLCSVTLFSKTSKISSQQCLSALTMRSVCRSTSILRKNAKFSAHRRSFKSGYSIGPRPRSRRISVQ